MNFISKNTFLLWILWDLQMILLTSGWDLPRIISTPDDPTHAFLGDNVFLAWRYHVPSRATLVEIVFGFYNINTGRLDRRLIAVNGSNAVTKVRQGYELSVRWAGNLSSSLAVFVLYNVSRQFDNKKFGIKLDCGFEYARLFEAVGLQVDEKPIADIPRITYITNPPVLSIGQNVSLICRASGLSFLNVTWYKGREIATHRGNGSSEAVVTLSKVTDKAWGEYICIAKNEVGEDRETVSVRVLPISPSILNSKKVVRNSSWVLRWSPVYSEGSLVMLYTVYYSLHVITNNVTRDVPWKSNNVTGFMYTTQLEARTPYVFAVTAWNRWGESSLENDKMLNIYTDFMDGITIKTVLSPAVERNNQIQSRNISVTLWAPFISLGAFCSILGAIYFIKRKLVDKKERNRSHRCDGVLNRQFFASQIDSTSQLGQESESISNSTADEQLRTPEINSREYYNQFITDGPGHRDQELLSPDLNSTATDLSIDGQEQGMRTFHPNSGSEVNNTHTNTAYVGEDPTNQSLEKLAAGANQSTDFSGGYLQPVDNNNFQVKGRNSPRATDRHAQTSSTSRPKPKPRLKILGKREVEKSQSKNSGLVESVSTDQFRANNSFPSRIENDQLSTCVEALDRIQCVTSQLKTFPGDRKHGYPSYQNVTNQCFPLQPHGSHESPYSRVFSNANWELSPKHLSLKKRIGGGSFGQVWKGMAYGVVGAEGWSVVAVKMLKDNSSKSDLRDLMSELDLLKRLKPHPNVIQLLGCVTKDVVRHKGQKDFRPPLVILEFVPYGDLLGYLRKSRGENDDYYNLRRENSTTPKITRRLLYQFACDVACGMEFISSHQLIHRDLAARNILVGDGMRCKITDFGMARDLGTAEIYIRRSNGLMPVKWMAVESLVSQVFTIESDVWSYGIVLYEIFTQGGRPYDGMTGEEVFGFVASGKRLPRSPTINTEIYDLMQECWQEDPSKRPTFRDILSWMENLPQVSAKEQFTPVNTHLEYFTKEKRSLVHT
ncbi:uncharacterized protein [Montipora capricornis]|uniref:uncharacterized protein n=1 Tax=Montipora capricornis TaxID=246305 RepID=UPI0035F15AFE